MSFSCFDYQFYFMSDGWSCQGPVSHCCEVDAVGGMSFMRDDWTFKASNVIQEYFSYLRQSFLRRRQHINDMYFDGKRVGFRR